MNANLEGRATAPGLRFPDPAPDAYRFPLMISHLLSAAEGHATEQLIVYRDGPSFSYRDIRQRIARLASVLSAFGSGEGTTVAVMDWDSHRYLEAFFAVPMMGAVLQTVNVRLPVDQIIFTLDEAGAEILLVHRDFMPLLAHIRSVIPALKAVIVIADGNAEPWAVQHDGEYEELLAAAPADFPFRDFDENAIATTFYTTGTTGNPKGVSFTHRQIVLHSLALATALGTAPPGERLGSDDVYMPLTPMFHVHAWGMPYIATMLGLKQVYPGRYEPETICRLRSSHGVSFSHCVPTVLQMVFQAADVHEVDLSGWKMVIGGSPLTKALYREGVRRGVSLAAGYGMSETCPAISIARSGPSQADEDNADIMTLAGVPIPLVRADIVDGNMDRQRHDGRARGELVLRAPWLVANYVKASEASAALWTGGWLHTLDIASIDASGRISIRDRLKDVIKTGGEWIDSQQLEDILVAIPGISEVAVIAVPDERWGERPLAIVVPIDHAPTLDQLNAPILDAITSGAITRYARLDRYELLARLPMTSVGKVDKKFLREQYSKGSSVFATDAPDDGERN